MKNNLISLALGLLLAFAATPPTAAAPGETGQPVSLLRVDDARYLVRISNPGQQAATLRLLRQDDKRVLFEMQSHQAACGQQLNLRDLADGRYEVVVSIGKDEYRYHLRINTTTQRQTVVEPGPVARR